MPEDVKAIDPVEAQRALDLIQDLWNDDVAGSRVRAKAKEKYPNIRLPEETMSPLLKPLTTQIEALTAELKKRDERDAERDKQRAERAEKARQDKFIGDLDAAVKQYSLTEDGKKAVIERMQQTQAYDPYAAAAYIVSQNPPPPPPGPVFGPQSLNFAGSAIKDEDRKLLHTNPEAYFDSEVRKMLANPRDYVAQELGEFTAQMAFGG